MRRNRSWRCLELAALSLVLTSSAAPANADPIKIPGYTVTELGRGTPTFSMDANGNGVLNAPNGQIYAFPQTPNTNLTPGQGIMAGIPLLNPPSTAGAESFRSPNNIWNYDATAVMNSNGIVAAIYVSGVGDHFYTDQGYYVQHNPDGSWGQPVTVFQGTEQPAAIGAPLTFKIVGLSNANQLLINNYSTVPGTAGAMVYNINTKSMTNLITLLSAANPYYLDPQAIAIDDDGRILLNATSFNPNVGFTPTNLLLTPDILSSGPLEVPAPEPGALAVGLLAIAGYAAHQVRERHRHSCRE